MRGSILEDATPTATKHGTGRGLPLKDALEYVIPELNIHCLRLALSTPKVTEQLLKLDEQGVSRGRGHQGTAALLLGLLSVFVTFSFFSKRSDLLPNSRGAKGQNVTGSQDGNSLRIR